MKTIQSIERATELQDALIVALPTEVLEKLQQDCVTMASNFRTKRLRNFLKLVAVPCAVTAILWGKKSPMQASLITAFGIALAIWMLWTTYLLIREKLGDFEIVFDLNGRKFSFTETTTSSDDPANLRFWNEARQGAHGMIKASVAALTTDQRNRQTIDSMSDFGAVCWNGALLVFGWWLLQSSPIFVVLVVILLIARIIPRRLDPNDFCAANAYTTIIQVLDSRGAQRGTRRL